MVARTAGMILLIEWGLIIRAQLGVNIYQSQLPFIGVNFEQEHLLTELRLGTNRYFDNMSFELTINGIVASDTSYDIYSGVGGWIRGNGGVLVPVGINVYPFDNQRLGFQVEAAGITQSFHSVLLRGSWGIRYRFR